MPFDNDRPVDQLTARMNELDRLRFQSAHEAAEAGLPPLTRSQHVFLADWVDHLLNTVCCSEVNDQVVDLTIQLTGAFSPDLRG